MYQETPVYWHKNILMIFKSLRIQSKSLPRHIMKVPWAFGSENNKTMKKKKRVNDQLIWFSLGSLNVRVIENQNWCDFHRYLKVLKQITLLHQSVFLHAFVLTLTLPTDINPWYSRTFIRWRWNHNPNFCTSHGLPIARTFNLSGGHSLATSLPFFGKHRRKSHIMHTLTHRGQTRSRLYSLYYQGEMI